MHFVGVVHRGPDHPAHLFYSEISDGIQQHTRLAAVNYTSNYCIKPCDPFLRTVRCSGRNHYRNIGANMVYVRKRAPHVGELPFKGADSWPAYRTVCHGPLLPHVGHASGCWGAADSGTERRPKVHWK